MQNGSKVSPKYNRILLKISGESLMGDRQFGLDPSMVDRVAGEISTIIEYGVEVCVVIGGGNIFRGVSGAANGMERATADYMGMLATVMNALAMQSSLEQMGSRAEFNLLYQYRQYVSHISGVALCVIWRKNVLSFLLRARVTRFSLRTLLLRCEPQRWVVTLY